MGWSNRRRLWFPVGLTVLMLAAPAGALCPKKGDGCSLGGQTTKCTKDCVTETWVCSTPCPTCERVWAGPSTKPRSAGSACGLDCLGACDGAGTCDNVTPWPPGTTCGNKSTTACKDPDTCGGTMDDGGVSGPGTGQCLVNAKNEGQTCSVTGTCASGVCVKPDAGAPDAGGSGGAGGNAGAGGSSAGAAGAGGSGAGGAGGAGNAGAAGGGPDAGTQPSAGKSDDGGCGCRTESRRPTPMSYGLLLLGVVLLGRRRSGSAGRAPTSPRPASGQRRWQK